MLLTFASLYFGNNLIIQELENYAYQHHENAFVYSVSLAFGLIWIGFFYTFFSIKKKLYSIL
jgi:hypothetical protein